jgi:hypothetical protein
LSALLGLIEAAAGLVLVDTDSASAVAEHDAKGSAETWFHREHLAIANDDALELRGSPL